MFAFPSVNLGECFNQHKNGNECRLVDKYENVKKLIEKEGLKWLGKTEDFRDSPRIRVGFGFQGKYDSHGYIWILTEMHWKIVEEESKLFLLDFFALMLIYLPNGVMNDEDSIEEIMKRYSHSLLKNQFDSFMSSMMNVQDLKTLDSLENTILQLLNPY